MGKKKDKLLRAALSGGGSGGQPVPWNSIDQDVIRFLVAPEVW
jgi:hypothetical protein